MPAINHFLVVLLLVKSPASTDVGNQRPVDILVNAAGVAQNSFLFKTQFQDSSNIINTNLMGTIWGCQLLAQKMMTQKKGEHAHVVLVCLMDETRLTGNCRMHRQRFKSSRHTCRKGGKRIRRFQSRRRGYESVNHQHFIFAEASNA